MPCYEDEDPIKIIVAADNQDPSGKAYCSFHIQSAFGHAREKTPETHYKQAVFLGIASSNCF